MHPVRVRSSRPLPLIAPIANHPVSRGGWECCSQEKEARDESVDQTGVVRKMKELGWVLDYVPTVTLECHDAWTWNISWGLGAC